MKPINTTRPTFLLALTFVLVAIFSALSGNAQNVKQDSNGNYSAIGRVKDSTSATNSGKLYTDAKGNVYPVMISKNGKLFIVRISRSGLRYNYYLKS